MPLTFAKFTCTNLYKQLYSFFFFTLLNKKRIELVFLIGCEGWSYEKIAYIFNAHHSRRVLFNCGEVVRKFNMELMHWILENSAKCLKLCIPNGRNHF